MATVTLDSIISRVVNKGYGNSSTGGYVIGYDYMGSMYVNPHLNFYQFITFDLGGYKYKNITKVELLHSFTENNNATGDELYIGYYYGKEPTYSDDYEEYKIKVLTTKVIDNTIVGSHTEDITKVMDEIIDSNVNKITVTRHTNSIKNASNKDRNLRIGPSTQLRITYNGPTAQGTITSTTYPPTPWSSFSVNWSYSSNSVYPEKDKQADVKVQYKYVDESTWKTVPDLSKTATTYRFGANTFLQFKHIQWRVQVKGGISDWSDWATQTIQFNAKKPTTTFNLNSEPESPFKDIQARWTFASDFKEDVQQSSQFRYKVSGSNTWTNVTVNGTDNRYTIKANTFKDYKNIELQARVQSIYGGWSDWKSYIIEFPLYPPNATNLAPTSPQQPKVPIRLNWAYTNNDERKVDPQSSSEVEYRKVGSSQWINKTVNNTTNSFTIPANTFSLSDSRVEFRVRVTGAYNGVGSWSDVARFDLQSTPPFAPQLLYPVNSYPKATEDIYFQWYYSSSLGDVASRSQIQIEKNGVLVVDQTIQGSSNIYVYKPDTISYKYRWRVKNTNSVGEVGNWSNWADFQTLGKPTTPTITSHSNENLSLFNFAMVENLNWKLDIFKGENLVYTSGIMRYLLAYRLKEYLPNGDYTAKLRCFDQNEESDLYIYNFSINTEVFGDGKLSAINNGKNAIELFFKNNNNKALIYRDGKLIKEIDTPNTNYYKDVMCSNNISHKYFVRFIDGYNMLESEHVVAACYSDQMLIADYNNSHNYIVPKAVTDIVYNSLADKVEHIFVGRSAPVVSFDGTVATTIDVSIMATYEQTLGLQKLADKKTMVFVKHRKFGTITGFFTGFSITVGKHYNLISFTVKKGGSL